MKSNLLCTGVLLALILPVVLLKANQPNVLFIIVDDMNGYAVFDEYANAKTPHIDAFKQEAVTFTKAYCAVAKCVPSRAAVMSGLPANITGAYLDESKPWQNSKILKSCEALPECFQKNGYYTWGRGKTFHNNPPNGRHGNMWNNKYHGGGFGPFVTGANQIQGKWWGVQAYPDKDFPDVYNTDSAVSFLNKTHSEPFFLTIGLYRPHTPFTAPQRFFDMYNLEDITIPSWYLENDLDDVPQAGRNLIDFNNHWSTSGIENEENWKKLIWAYLACNSFVDYNIGRLLTALEDNQLNDNTIVVVWSDNGYHCGEKNHWEKSLMWEQATNTPLFIKIPGMASAGETYHAPVSLVDIYPTLVDYCNLQKPKNELAGISLRPFLEDTELVLDRPIVSFNQRNHITIRSYNYRYLQYPDGSEELYNHLVDSYEHTNLALNLEYKPIIEDMKSWIPKTMNTYTNTSYEIEQVTYDTLFYSVNSLNAYKKGKIRIYPNPVCDRLYVKTYNSLIKQIQLTDITGRLVKVESEKVGANYVSVNLNGVEVGQYLLNIQTKEFQETKKIIVR